jgi:hypothetical protein
VEQKKGEVTLPRDEEDSLKKRKVSPPKPSSRKKSKATRNKFETTLTSDDFDFIVATLNDASLEIVEKKEAKQEEVFSWIKVEIKEVHQALRSNRIVSIVPLSVETPEIQDEPSQLHWIADTVKAHLRQTQKETSQATQDLVQAQEDLLEKCHTSECEKITLQERFHKKKSQLHKEKEQLLTEQLKV